jgi:hypothetical protein
MLPQAGDATPGAAGRSRQLDALMARRAAKKTAEAAAEDGKQAPEAGGERKGAPEEPGERRAGNGATSGSECGANQHANQHDTEPWPQKKKEPKNSRFGFNLLRKRGRSPERSTLTEQELYAKGIEDESQALAPEEAQEEEEQAMLYGQVVFLLKRHGREVTPGVVDKLLLKYYGRGDDLIAALSAGLRTANNQLVEPLSKKPVMRQQASFVFLKPDARIVDHNRRHDNSMTYTPSDHPAGKEFTDEEVGMRVLTDTGVNATVMRAGKLTLPPIINPQLRPKDGIYRKMHAKVRKLLVYEGKVVSNGVVDKLLNKFVGKDDVLLTLLGSQNFKKRAPNVEEKGGVEDQVVKEVMDAHDRWMGAQSRELLAQPVGLELSAASKARAEQNNLEAIDAQIQLHLTMTDYQQTSTPSRTVLADPSVPDDDGVAYYLRGMRRIVTEHEKARRKKKAEMDEEERARLEREQKELDAARAKEELERLQRESLAQKIAEAKRKADNQEDGGMATAADRPAEDLASVWLEPDIAKAKELRKQAIFEQGEASLANTSAADMSIHMGPGISLYFIFLEKLFLYFAMAAVLSVPSIILNMQGSGATLADASKSFGLLYTTLGNQGVILETKDLGYCTLNQDMLGCNNGTKVGVLGAKLESSTAGCIVMLCDLISMVLFIRMYGQFQSLINETVEQDDDDKISASDFGVWVTGLPATATEDQIRNHFNERYDCDRDGWHYYPNRCGFIGLPTNYAGLKFVSERYKGMDKLAPKRVRNVDHHASPEGKRAKKFQKSWIANVSVANPLGSRILMYRKNAELQEAQREVKKYSAGSQWRNYAAMEEKGKLEEMRREAGQKVAELRSKIKEFERKLQTMDTKPIRQKDGTEVLPKNPREVCVGAFVTFNNEESWAVCLDNYQYSQSYFGSRFQHQELRFRDEDGKKHIIAVERAVEPDEVKWENLEYVFEKEDARNRNVLLSRGITLLVLLISFVVILVAEVLGSRAGETMAYLPYCDTKVPANYFGSEQLVPEDGITPIHNKLLDDTCPDGQYYITYPDPTNDTLREPIPDPSTIDPAIRGAVKAGTMQATDVYRFDKELGGRLGAFRHGMTAYPRAEFYRWDDSVQRGNVSGGYAWDVARYEKNSLGENTGNFYQDTLFVSNETYRSGSMPDLCTASCVDMTDMSLECSTLPCVVPSLTESFGAKCEKFPRAQIGLCYCDAKVKEASARSRWGILGALKGVTEEEPLCMSYAKSYITATVMGQVTAFIIVFVNTVLEKIMWYCTEIEHHPSISSHIASISVKIFITQFINTAIVVMVVNARPPNGITLGFLQQFGILAGRFPEYNRGWYAVVGTNILFTMAINIVEPNVMPFIEEYIRLLSAWLTISRDKVNSQRHMINMHQPTEMPMEARYALILNVIFVTLLFSSGMPILNPMAMLFIASAYACDKFMLLRVFKKPYYDAALADITAKMLPFGAMMHCLNGFWMYGVNDLMLSQQISILDSFLNYRALVGKLALVDPFGAEGFAVKILRLNCFPLLALFAILVALRILPDDLVEAPGKIVAAYETMTFEKVVNICCGSGGDYPARLDRTLGDMPICAYTEAFERRVGEDDALKPLAFRDLEAGWRHVKVDSGKSRGQTCVIRIWIKDGKHLSGCGEHKGKLINHKKGDRMLTWRAMPTLASYDILANPLYRQFLANSVYFNETKRAKIAQKFKVQKKKLEGDAKAMKKTKKEEAKAAQLTKKYNRLKKKIKKTVKSSKFFKALLRKGGQADKVAPEGEEEEGKKPKKPKVVLKRKAVPVAEEVVLKSGEAKIGISSVAFRVGKAGGGKKMDKRMAQRDAAMKAALRLVAAKQGKISPAEEDVKGEEEFDVAETTSSQATGAQWGTFEDAWSTCAGARGVPALGREKSAAHAAAKERRGSTRGSTRGSKTKIAAE